jgi:type II secretion system protein H
MNKVRWLKSQDSLNVGWAKERVATCPTLRTEGKTLSCLNVGHGAHASLPNLHPQFTQKQLGISYIEIMIVVVILGIIAAVVIPNLSSADPGKLDLAAQEFANAMRFARSEAIRVGEPRGFRQQSSQKRIRVFQPDTSTSPWTLNYDVYHPISKKLYDIQLDSHPFAAADTLSRNSVYRGTCNNQGNIYFDSNGTPWCADPETALLKQFEVTLTLSSHSRIVTLHPITGRVTVQ